MSSENGRGLRSAVAKTAAYTIVAGRDNGKTFTNEGAPAAVTFTLPPATVGQWYRFKSLAAFELRIDPSGTETIALPSTGAQGAAGKYLTFDAPGEGVEVECVKAGAWAANYAVGTITQEV